MAPPIYTVLTGDVIGSSRFVGDQSGSFGGGLKPVLQACFSALESDARIGVASPFAVYRQDEFQGVVEGYRDAVRAALFVRAYLRSRPRSGGKYLDARISVGVGKVSHLPTGSALDGYGEAFTLSGRNVGRLTRDSLNLLVTTPWQDLNEELEVECSLVDPWISRWSTEQAEAVLFKLHGKKQQEIGDLLHINQSAVSQRLLNANWQGIAKFMERYERAVAARLPAAPAGDPAG